jgi:hypothetical protein
LDDYAYFTIAIADGVTTVTCNGKASRNILYLNGTTCFACYNTQSSAQYIKPNLYKEVSDTPTPLATVKTIYCKNVQSWWNADGAAVSVYAFADGDVNNAAWPGVRMEAVTGEEGLWKADIDTAKYEKIIFVRVNGTGDLADWGAQTEDLAVPADKDLYTITSTSAQWSGEGNKVTGEWSVYGEEPTPVDPPTPVDSMTVYIVNTLDWATVNAFVWPAEGNAYKEWPGEAMTPVNTQINGKDVYAYTFPASFANIIFNNGTDQTVDLTWAEATPYFVPGEKNAQNKYEGAWYAKENIPAPVDPAEGGTVIFEWTKGTGAKIEADNTDLSANDMGAMTVGTSVVARLLGTNTIDNNAKGYKLGNNDVCVEIQGTSAFAVGDTVVITGVCGGSGARAFAIAPVTTINAATDTALTNTQENTSDILEYKVVVKEAQAGDKMRIFRLAGKTMYLYSIKVVHPAGDTPEPPVAAKFYVTGDSALVVDAGMDKAKAWTADAIKSETDTFTLNLKANQDYVLKVVVGENWLGYDKLTEKTEGLKDLDGDNHNIGFKLTEAGAVKVIYIAGETPIFKLEGNFYVEPTPQPAEHTYTVAGGSDVAFGTAWDPKNTANDMVKQEDGTYKWEKAELTLAAGTIMFKVCEDHAWTVAYPAQDYGLAIPEAGIYTITITFSADTKEVAAVATKTGSAVVLPTIAMHGNFLGSWADTENFTVAEGNETASLTMTLAAGNYEFGMRIGGSGNWTANGVVFTRENNSAAVVAGQGNLTLAADAAGEYTFMWIYASNTLVITFPEIAPAQPEYYLVGSMTDWAVVAEEQYHFAPNAVEGEYVLTITLTAGQSIKVVGVEGQTQTWYPEGTGNEYVVDATHAGNVTIYFRPAGNPEWAAFGGYIYIDATTGMDNTADGIQAVKVIRDGQLLIIKGDKTFNSQGQMVK